MPESSGDRRGSGGAAARETGAHLCGRPLYEEMRYWETADQQLRAPEHVLEFGRIWKETPKVVFSRTLEQVEGNARLVREGAAEDVARPKEPPGRDLAVGGAGLAANFMKLGLIDEYRLVVSPVALGTPYFPALDERIDLELVETRTLGSRSSTSATSASRLPGRLRRISKRKDSRAVSPCPDLGYPPLTSSSAAHPTRAPVPLA